MDNFDIRIKEYFFKFTRYEQSIKNTKIEDLVKKK